MRDFFMALTRNRVGLVGVAIATASAAAIVTLFINGLLGFRGGPYIGIIAYLILPTIFVVGLLLIPLGAVLEVRRARRSGATAERRPASFPVIDLNRGQTRRRVLLVLLLTVVNVVILSSATYKGVEVMDSTVFCGTACHSVMAPEYTQYQRSPHARVKCVECHIGPGAGWFARSKLSGAWQVVAVALDLYPRPIPTPVHDLRPARETCEQCHWPTKFVGDRLKVIHHYGNDEENSELVTVLLLRVGGLKERAGQGIHWHVDPNIEIRYLSDEKRQKISQVELREPDGTLKSFFAPQPEDDAPGATGEWRVMDCVDCHNRPTHVFRLPEEEVDTALAGGRISRDLPYVRREGIRVLRQDYGSHDEARNGIPAALTAFYQESYPELAAEKPSLIEEAGRVLAEIYTTNVFPTMGVDWGTYPNHIGHETSDGCFRCHDDEHESADGEAISQDCDACHSLLAWEEEDPEILKTLDI